MTRDQGWQVLLPLAVICVLVVMSCVTAVDGNGVAYRSKGNGGDYRLESSPAGNGRNLKFNGAPSKGAVVPKKVGQDEEFVAQFTDGSSRTFRVPNQHIAYLVKSSQAGESGKTVAMFLDLQPMVDVPDAHNVLVSAVHDFLSAYAEISNLVIAKDESLASTYPGIASLGDVETAFAGAQTAVLEDVDEAAAAVEAKLKSANQEEKTRLRLAHALDTLGRMKNAIPASVKAIRTWAAKVDELDISSCLSNESDPKVLSKEFYKAEVLDKMKPPPNSGTVDPLSSRMEGWIRDGAKAGAKAMIDQLDGMLKKEEDSARAQYQGDLELRWFVPENERRIQSARTAIKGQQKSLEDELFRMATTVQPVRHALSKTDKTITEVEEFFKDRFETYKKFVLSIGKSGRKEAELNKKIQEEVKKSSPDGTLNLGEQSIIQSAFRAVAMAKVSKCQQVAEIEVNKVPEKWKSKYKFDVDPKVKFSGGKLLVEKIGLNQELTFSKGLVSHKAFLKLDVENPFSGKDMNLRAKAGWEGKNGPWSAGANVDIYVVGVLTKDIYVKDVICNVFAGYNNGQLKTGIFASVQLPFQKDATTGAVKQSEPVITLSHSLDLRISKKFALSTSAMVKFTPSTIQAATASVTAKYSLTDRTALTGSLNYNMADPQNRQFFETRVGVQHTFRNGAQLEGFAGYRQYEGRSNPGLDKSSWGVGVQLKIPF